MTKEQEMELDYLYFLLELNKTLDKSPKNIKNMKAVQLEIQTKKKLIKERYLPFSFIQYNDTLRLVKKFLPKELTKHLKEMNSSNENQVLNVPKVEFCNDKTKFQLMCSHLQKSIRKQEQSKSNDFERGM